MGKTTDYQEDTNVNGENYPTGVLFILLPCRDRYVGYAYDKAAYDNAGIQNQQFVLAAVLCRNPIALRLCHSMYYTTACRERE
jgi:hypothetical protein